VSDVGDDIRDEFGRKGKMSSYGCIRVGFMAWTAHQPDVSGAILNKEVTYLSRTLLIITGWLGVSMKGEVQCKS